MKKNIEILWEGYLPLEKVSWQFDEGKKVIFSDEFQQQCEQNWIEMKKQYPNIYDGSIVAVQNIDYQKDEIVFQLGTIRYSQLTFLYKQNKPLDNSLGSLGFQALIYNLTHTHILLGQRVSTSDYRPGAFATPGGIFETFDTKGTISDACIREIQEETYLAIKPETMRLLAIFREASMTSIGLIIEVESLKDIELPTIEGNDEWENKQLEWFPISNIVDLDVNLLMDSLVYVRNLELEF